jgi:hypothetical protein
VNIYLVQVPAGHSEDYDCTQGIVVIAASPEEAKYTTRPSPMLEEIPCSVGEERNAPITHWDIDPNELDVLLLGPARLGARPGIILEDNRGS